MPKYGMEIWKYDLVRKTIKWLYKQPEVRKAHMDGSAIHVGYHDGTTEHWVYDHRLKFHNERWFIIDWDEDYLPFDEDKFPEWRGEFNRNPLDPNYEQAGKFFNFKHRHLKQYKTSNTRVWMHRFANELAECGYVQPWQPEKNKRELTSELQKMSWNYMGPRDNIRIMPNYLHMAKQLRYMDMDPKYIGGYWDPKNIFLAIDNLYKHKADITRYNISADVGKRRDVKSHVHSIVFIAHLVRKKFHGAPIIDLDGRDWLKTVSTINETPHNDPDGIPVTSNYSKVNDRDAIYLGNMGVEECYRIVECEMLECSERFYSVLRNGK